MKQYAILCNDMKTGIWSYYDLDEQCLYQYDDSVGRRTRLQSKSEMGKWGGGVCVLICSLSGKFVCNLPLTFMFLISILVGIVASLLYWNYTVHFITNLLSTEEKLYLSNDELVGIYKKGRLTRFILMILELFLLSLAVFADIYAWVTKDSIVFSIAMLLYWGVGVVICTYRPICTLKWKQQMRKNGRA